MMKNKKNNSGFSLVELSLVMVISSVIIGHLLGFATEKQHDSKLKSTKDNFSIVEEAISDFLIKNGRLPCPSSFTEDIYSSNSGIENLSSDKLSCIGTVTNPYESTTANDFLAIGTIPTKSLGIPDDLALDSWGRRMTYVAVKACAQSQTGGNTKFFRHADNTCGNGSSGHLRILDQSGGTISLDAVFVIVSHGSNGHGAISRLSYDRIKSSEKLSEDEIKNAQLDANGQIVSNDGVFVQRSMNLNKSDGYYDDLISYQTRNQIIQNSNGLLKNGSYLSYLCKISDKIPDLAAAQQICGPNANVDCAQNLTSLAGEIGRICY